MVGACRFKPSRLVEVGRVGGEKPTGLEHPKQPRGRLNYLVCEKNCRLAMVMLLLRRRQWLQPKLYFPGDRQIWDLTWK
jgi:hypothetical protein